MNNDGQPHTSVYGVLFFFGFRALQRDTSRLCPLSLFRACVLSEVEIWTLACLRPSTVCDSFSVLSVSALFRALCPVRG